MITSGIDIPEIVAVEMGIPPEIGEYDLDIEVLHYDIEIVVPAENDRISSFTTIHYLHEAAGAHWMTLDFTGMAVEAVEWHGEPLEFSYADGQLRFLVPGGAPLDTLRVGIATRGVPQDGLILRDNVHGVPSAFADNWPNRARFWFPSIDHPSHKATVGFTVHAPEGKRVIANGVQVGNPELASPEQAGGVEGLVTWRWISRVPIPTYLMVIGVADMVVMEGGLAACGMAPASVREDGCVELSAWAFPPDTAHAREVFRRSGEMIDLYSRTFGPYPYEKLANVQSSTRFGGMENASAIFYSEGAIAQRRNIEGTVAHEIAHQWFGNSVTPADWPHLWLSEGFASYFGPWFWEETEGVEAFRERLARSRATYLDSDDVNRPVIDRDADNLLDLLNRNSYQKGALVLHMLRWVIGDEDFFDAVRHYYQRHAGGNAVTDDFRLAVEEVHGEPLGWFFDQWLESPGYPVFRTTWTWDEAASEVVVAVRQEQDVNWPTFRMPLEFAFHTADGIERRVEWIDQREMTFRVGLPSAPTEVMLDPDRWLLMVEAGDR